MKQYVTIFPRGIAIINLNSRKGDRWRASVHVVVASSMRGIRVPGQKSSFAARLIKATTALPICQVDKVRGPCRRSGNYHRRARKFPEKYSLPEGREVNAGVAETKCGGKERRRRRERKGERIQQESKGERCTRRERGAGGKGGRGKGEEDSGWREQRSTPATLAATVAST